MKKKEKWTWRTQLLENFARTGDTVNDIVYVHGELDDDSLDDGVTLWTKRFVYLTCWHAGICEFLVVPREPCEYAEVHYCDVNYPDWRNFMTSVRTSRSAHTKEEDG